ncbi:MULTISPECIES: hypothetical protein [Streptomyces]|uniref:CBM2 domain-containing protein n=1 Tax=Streptomyces luteosporeus TaxID=173856 RepID=A0ABP6G0F4_9ACTN
MRRKTLVSASAAALWLGTAGALGALAAGCDSATRDGYVAAASGDAGPGGNVPPQDGVRLVPLPTPTSPPSQSPFLSPSPVRGTATPAPTPTPTVRRSVPAPRAVPPAHRPVPTPATSGGASPTRSSGSRTPTASPQPSPSPSASPAPPALQVSAPRREPAGDRWCEQVALTFTNTGGGPVTEGTVTLGTHVLGLWGDTDWTTVTTTRPLPAPIAAGEAAEGKWTVCVDAWRVLPGMWVETRDVTADWR